MNDEQLTAALLEATIEEKDKARSALRAILARHENRKDDPHLAQFDCPFGNALDDIAFIAEKALGIDPVQVPTC